MNYPNFFTMPLDSSDPHNSRITFTKVESWGGSLEELLRNACFDRENSDGESLPHLHISALNGELYDMVEAAITEHARMKGLPDEENWNHT